jgi:hypothetical protein
LVPATDRPTPEDQRVQLPATIEEPSLRCHGAWPWEKIEAFVRWIAVGTPP